MNDGRICTATLWILKIFMALAILVSLYIMCCVPEKRLFGTAPQVHTIQVASDGGPIPTCGPGPCKPTDDSIIHKIISILIG